MIAPVTYQLPENMLDLFLKNKEWLEEVCFMEGEHQFLRQKFEHTYLIATGRGKLNELAYIQDRNNLLTEYTNKLKEVLAAQQRSLVSIFQQPAYADNQSLFNVHLEINEQVKDLFGYLTLYQHQLHLLLQNIQAALSSDSTTDKKMIFITFFVDL